MNSEKNSIRKIQRGLSAFKPINMNYIIAEIQENDLLRVIYQNIPEDKIEYLMHDNEYDNKNLVAIPHKTILVKSTNYGYNTEVEIK